MDVIELTSNMSTILNGGSPFDTDIILSSKITDSFELSGTATAELTLNSHLV